MGIADGIRNGFAPGGESLAIPSWVIAGEPISQFASHIAKYFSNSIREDGMLAVATAGIVFAPGAPAPCRRSSRSRPERRPHVRPQPYGVPRHPSLLRGDGLYPALQRQAERLGFADLLSVGDEPEQILDRFPAGRDAAEPDGMPPEMLVWRMRNAR